jgi:hypothetical protein
MAQRMISISAAALGLVLAATTVASADYRSSRGDRVVEAPTTRVETNRRGKVAVDAPFTSVRRDNRGVHVRAPFVDIYVPRRY